MASSGRSENEAIFSLTGQIALVTGAGGGIGRAVAVALARAGANVAITYHRDEAGAQETLDAIRQLDREGIAVQADLSSPGDAERAAEAARALGPIDILVNNAGTMVRRQRIVEMPLEIYEAIMAVNVRSVFLMCKAVLPSMIERRRGRIINISSVAARTGGSPGAVPYAAAKAAVSTFTRGLAKEVADYGILVNAVAPGVIDTRFHQQYTAPEAFEAMVRTIPLGRAGVPDDVSGAVLFLASGLSDYITGEVIEVNGGMLMS